MGGGRAGRGEGEQLMSHGRATLKRRAKFESRDNFHTYRCCSLRRRRAEGRRKERGGEGKNHSQNDTARPFFHGGGCWGVSLLLLSARRIINIREDLQEKLSETEKAVFPPQSGE